MQIEMSELPKFVRDYLDEIALTEGLSNHKIEVEAGSNNGDNFMAAMFRVALKGDRSVAGQIVPHQLNLICKLASPNAERRKELRLNICFDREATFYNRVFPAFAAFQKERGLSPEDGFFGFPKCYKAVADEESNQFLLILEDLKPKGFVMWPKEKIVALDHFQLILQEIAKFHAVSFAMRDQEPDVFEEFQNISDHVIAAFKTPKLRGMVLRSHQRVLDVLRNENHSKYIHDLRDNFVEIYIKCLGEGEAGRFGAMTHGDFWINNILFQYGDEVSQA